MWRSLVLLIATLSPTVGMAGTGFSISNAQVTEGDSGTVNLAFNVSLDTCPTGCSVKATAITLTGNLAEEGVDYQTTVTNLGFPSSPGPQNQTFNVPVIGESVVELDETLTVLLSDPVGASIDDGVATGTILNNDSAVLTMGDRSLPESGQVLVHFGLSNPVQGTVFVTSTSVDGTATVADDDYTTADGPKTMPPLTTSTLKVMGAIVADLKVELDEQYTIQYSDLDPGGLDVTLGTSVSTITLDNNDVGMLSIDDVSQAEGDAGTTQFNFTVTLDREVDVGVDVDFETRDGTATTADNDYEFTSGTLMFQGMENEDELVSVTVNGDTDNEADEFFEVVLSGIDASGRNVQFADHLGIGTIQTDEDGQIFSDGFESGDTSAWTTTIDP